MSENAENIIKEVPAVVKKFKLSDYQVGMIEAFAISGVAYDQIASHLRLTKWQLIKKITSEPDVHAIYKSARDKAVMQVGATLYRKAIGGDTTSMIFYLKTQGRWKENHEVQEERQVSGPDLTGWTFEQLFLMKYGRLPSAEEKEFSDPKILKIEHNAG